MADDGKHAETPDSKPGNGGDAGMDAGKEKWNQDDWERYANSEADRRSANALKRMEDKYQSLLGDTKTTAEAKLKEYESQLATARAQADFLGAATTMGVVDTKAAWAVAREFGHIADGKVEWEKMKADHPLLFGGGVPQKQTSAAGAAPDVGGGGKPDMNKLLRQAAGHRG